MPDWLDNAGAWTLLVLAIGGLIGVGAAVLRGTPARCPMCNVPKGTVHKPRCNYLVKQGGG